MSLSISNYIISVNTLAHHELILVETPLEIILIRNRWCSNNSNNLILQHFLSSSAPVLWQALGTWRWLGHGVCPYGAEGEVTYSSQLHSGTILEAYKKCLASHFVFPAFQMIFLSPCLKYLIHCQNHHQWLHPHKVSIASVPLSKSSLLWLQLTHPQYYHQHVVKARVPHFLSPPPLPSWIHPPSSSFWITM